MYCSSKSWSAVSRSSSHCQVKSVSPWNMMWANVCAIPWCLFPPNCHPPINHPGGTFYWLIISQLSFHEPPLLPLTANTFKIFIIKGIRLCLNYSDPSPERPITKALAGWILFEHSSRAAECLSRAATIFTHRSFVSWMSAVITTTDPGRKTDSVWNQEKQCGG